MESDVADPTRRPATPAHETPFFTSGSMTVCSTEETACLHLYCSLGALTEGAEGNRHLVFREIAYPHSPEATGVATPSIMRCKC